MAYRYAPAYRPPVSCNLPHGLRFELVEAPRDGQWRADIPRSAHRFGVIETAEPIDAETCRHFDLRPVD